MNVNKEVVFEGKKKARVVTRWGPKNDGGGTLFVFFCVSFAVQKLFSLIRSHGFI